MKKILFNLLLTITLFYFIFINKVFANDFITDYQVIYNLSNFKNTLSTEVNLKIKITNLKSDLYVDKFTINFPSNNSIEDLEILDDNGKIVPSIYNLDDYKRVEMIFNDPKIGKGTVNNLFLKYQQKNLFKINGNIWEVFLPIIENNNGNYQVYVILPQDENKKISISKPKPTLISGNQIYWENPKSKVIYAVFGDSQIYDVSLIYHLENNQIRPFFTEIAFPPDSLYQKIYINNINPQPIDVYQDDDGNLLGKYFLNPKEKKTILFQGYVEVFSQWRDEFKNANQEKINHQKNYLLNTDYNWQIKSKEKIDNLNTVFDIYRFVVDNLKYDYSKIDKPTKRLSAEKVINNPDKAICIDFTDLFVGIAREKGILAREIQGYGFSFDPKIQPISLNSDILHSWPEYYDEKNKLWMQVDPTWENTSKIDYFNSFDLNHIIFAIHGKKSDYPIPAGMYKTDYTQDISIKPITTILKNNKKLEIISIDLPKTISASKKYQGKITIINKSNIYLYNEKINVKTDLVIDKKEFNIISLAPFEKKTFNFNFYLPDKNKIDKTVNIQVFYLDNLVVDKKINISQFDLKIIFIFLFVIFIIFYLIFIKK